MMTNSIHKRIDYFDLMKGVCIVLVIISHCCVELKVDLFGEKVGAMLENLRMPLYFFLSGMFFKEYSSFIDFIVRKFNKLVIPMLFFCVLTVIPKLIIGDIQCESKPVFIHIVWMVKHGGYLWFLRTLFFANIIYYIYNNITKRCNIYIKIGVLLCLVVFVWAINSVVPVGNFREEYSYLISVMSALIVLPFFYVAISLRQYLSKAYISLKWILIIFSVSLVVCYLSSQGDVLLMNAVIENSIVGFYMASFSAIACCLSVCVLIKKFPYLSYVGRYSIIAYLTHYPLISIVVYKFPHINIYYLIGVILLLMPLMIWIFKSIFPAFVAQRDVFIWRNRKIMVDWSAFSLKKR